MAYRLDPTCPTAEDIRRVATEQLDAAALGLQRSGADPGTVHDARKRLKKTRSLVRLARADLGRDAARQANDDLRAAGRALSDRRDADVLVEVAGRLLDATDEPTARSAVTAVRADFELRAAAAPLPTAAQLADVVGLVTTTSHRLAAAPPEAHGWPAIGPGLTDRYRRARQALATLGDDPDDDTLHDWRKRSKDVWYHLRLLEGVWPEVLAPVVSAAGRLADLLGDDHDLAVVTAHLSGPDATLAPVHDVVAAERARLQGEARRLGRRLFADRPRAWSGRLAAWWEATAAGDADPAP